MLTGDLRNKVDQVWNAFWSGGIANPIEVIEQITYLLFLRALDSDRDGRTSLAEIRAGAVVAYNERPMRGGPGGMGGPRGGGGRPPGGGGSPR